MENNIHSKINYKGTLEAWAKITIQEWRKKLLRMKIGRTQALAASFKHHVLLSSGGDYAKIQFLYLWYGAMVDMGVGKGTALGGVKENTIARRLQGKKNGPARKAKKWYSKVMYREMIILADILAKKYGDQLTFTAVERFSGQLGKIHIQL